MNFYIIQEIVRAAPFDNHIYGLVATIKHLYGARRSRVDASHGNAAVRVEAFEAFQ